MVDVLRNNNRRVGDGEGGEEKDGDEDEQRFGASLDSHLEYRSAEGTPEDPSIPINTSSQTFLIFCLD